MNVSKIFLLYHLIKNTMNFLFLIGICLVATSTSAVLLAYIFYRRLNRLQRKYKYVINQLQLASSIYYGFNKNKSMPVPDEQV